jgi:hypothetical protein
MIRTLANSILIYILSSTYSFSSDSFMNFDFTDGKIENGLKNWSYSDLGENPCNVYNGKLQSKLCSVEGEKIAAYYSNANSFHKDWMRYGYIDASTEISVSGSALKVMMTGGAFPGEDGSVVYVGDPVKSKSQVTNSDNTATDKDNTQSSLPGATSIYFKTATSKTKFPKLQNKNRFSIWVLMPPQSEDIALYNKEIRKRPEKMMSWYPFINTSKAGHYYHNASNIPMGGWTKVQFDAHPTHHNGRVDNEYHAFSEGGNDYPASGINYFNNVAAFALKPHFAKNMPVKTAFFFDDFETDYVEFENEETINNIGVGYNPENHQFDISFEDKYRCSACKGEYDLRYSFSPITNLNFDNTYIPRFVTNFKRSDSNSAGKIYKSNNGYNQLWAAIDIQEGHVSKLSHGQNIYFALRDNSDRSQINQQSVDLEMIDVPNMGLIRTVDLIKTIPYQIIDVTFPLNFESDTLPAAYIGQLYQQKLKIHGGTPPYHFTYTGELPVGLTLNSSGKLLGNPLYPSSEELLIQVTDSENKVKEKYFTLNVLPSRSLNVEHCSTIVNFKDSEVLSEIIDQRFNTVFKDKYTGFTEHGVTITKGNNPNYNFQGLSGSGFTLLPGDIIRMVWKNDGNEGINFSPRVSFEQQARYKKSEQDLWLNAQSIHLDPGSSSVSELILTKEISNHFVNVNVNHANNKTLILDKLQFVEQLKSKTNLCAITPINIKHCKTIVDFKHSEILSEITDQRFNSVFKDRYTGFTEQGVTIKTGNNPNYNYQGLSGTGFTLLAGDTIRMVWKNEGNNTIDFSPKVSFTQKARYKKSEQDLWLNGQSIQLNPGSTAVSELILTKEISNNFININVNHANNKTLVLDKLQFVEQLSPETNVCLLGDQIE